MFQGFIGTAIHALGTGLAIVAFVDVLRRDVKVFTAVGQGSKYVWIASTMLCMYGAGVLQGIAGFISVLACILYFLDLRPKLEEATRN